ncbi:MAG: hypothetical protein K0S74_1498 [Chlamydiales bacterium]|jgi:hypothetical protein|nr:hypothetical protein [Chlamydiales bacterium]
MAYKFFNIPCKLLFSVLFMLNFCSCLYRAPTDDDVTILPMTNNPTITQPKHDESAILPHIAY